MNTGNTGVFIFDFVVVALSRGQAVVITVKWDSKQTRTQSTEAAAAASQRIFNTNTDTVNWIFFYG